MIRLGGSKSIFCASPCAASHPPQLSLPFPSTYSSSHCLCEIMDMIARYGGDVNWWGLGCTGFSGGSGRSGFSNVPITKAVIADYRDRGQGSKGSKGSEGSEVSQVLRMCHDSFPSFRPMGFVLNVKKDPSNHVGQKWRNLVTLSIISLGKY